MHDAAPDGNLIHPPGQPTQQAPRRKRTKERVRVTRACDHCKRGRAPSITWDNGVSSTASPDDNHTSKRGTEVSIQPNAVVDTISPSASPEPSQTDRQGHYVGPASGASFLLRVQKRVFESLRLPQTSSIFTFGDAPLPDADNSFFLLPPREDTKQLLNKYFDFAVPTHRYLHRPTLEAWFEELYATSGNMDSTDEAPARIALLFMVFAQASLYMPASVSSNSVVTDISARYFLVAEQQLKKERGQVRLASCTQRLEEWHKELADFLDADKINTALLLPIYQRQRNVLNAAYWHAKILTYRPFLLRKLGSSRGGKSPAGRVSTHVPQVEEGIQECLQAALSICNLVDQLINTEMMFKAFWFTSYYAFCAVVVLYVYTIQQTVSRTQGHQNYLWSAIRCQNQLSKIAEEGSLAERYCLVLEELRKEAVHRSEILQANISAAASIEKQPQQSEPIHPERSVLEAGTAMQHDFDAEQIPDAAGFGTTPGSSVYEISGWGAFDSIATSGFGNLDNLLGNEPFHF
ncbi:hypothetical protein VP1G_00981 [Cytospora mali]|uniref:Transcription factor domain-containing protein n=1 Tax=Cytospora mali TaxID=578113 RepID=A0A194UPN5_CYTMA|nr:hypothetical protein VP1G_00981 [Valsa mali var. pyri (nom. inval.)]